MTAVALIATMMDACPQYLTDAKYIIINTTQNKPLQETWTSYPPET